MDGEKTMQLSKAHESLIIVLNIVGFVYIQNYP